MDLPAAAMSRARSTEGAIPASAMQELSNTSSSSLVNGPGEAGQSFATMLKNMVQETNQKQLAAGAAIQGLQSGQDVPLHQAMIASEEASVSFQLMVEVRNKMLESYQELMRMQV